jgi:hypothetical protein
MKGKDQPEDLKVDGMILKWSWESRLWIGFMAFRIGTSPCECV